MVFIFRSSEELVRIFVFSDYIWDKLSCVDVDILCILEYFLLCEFLYYFCVFECVFGNGIIIDGLMFIVDFV